MQTSVSHVADVAPSRARVGRVRSDEMNIVHTSRVFPKHIIVRTQDTGVIGDHLLQDTGYITHTGESDIAD